MCDKDLVCKGRCCCILHAWEFLSAWSPGSWVWCSPSAEICVVPEGILSPGLQDSSSSLSPPSECQPCSMGWQECFQALEWVIQILWRKDLRHKQPRRKGQSETQSWDLGVWLGESPILHLPWGTTPAGNCKPDLGVPVGFPVPWS